MNDLTDDLDYLRSEAERLPNGTAARALRMMQPDAVTITISREDAERVMRGLPEASADFLFGRLALACRAALEGEK